MSTGVETQPRSPSVSTDPLPLNHVNAQNRSSSGVAPAVSEGIRRFDALLEKNGYESYDPYDIWGTKYGVFSRRVYYEKGIVGLPLIAPILLMEMTFPGLRGLFVKKERFATADGQLTLAYLNLYQGTQDKKFLEKAK